MRAAIVAFLHRHGIEPMRLRHVARLDCDVWRITPAGPAAAGGDLALRIYAADRIDRAPIEAELRWLLALADEGLHVPRPLPDMAGDYLRAWPFDASGAPRHALLLRWLPGRMHDRGLTPERLRRLGVFTARLHASAMRLAEAGRLNTPRLAYSAELPRWARGERPGATRLPRTLQTLTQATARRLIEEIAGFPVDTGAYGFVHGDLHPWNVLYRQAEAGAIDFSDCGWGHHALDLASVLQYLKHPLAHNHDHRPHYEQLRAGLLAGYAEVLPLAPRLSKQIETYLVARFFMTLEWMLDDWPRLDHRPWGPAFIAGSHQVFDDYLKS